MAIHMHRLLRDAGRFAYSPLSLLVVVGSLLAVSVLLSKVAVGLDAPMLTYLALAMGGSGLVLMLLRHGHDAGRARLRAFIVYSVCAGGLMALGSAVGYLTVHEVGAAFIALALAFPPMLTWLFSLLLGLERFDALRLLGLMIGLAGGVVLAFGKGISTSSGMGAIVIACTMPVILAVGNVFRTQYWPEGAKPRELAGAMLVCGALMTLPFAVHFEGMWAFLDLFERKMLVVVAIAILTFVAQYVALFRLQQVAGPVYLSQIGSVAAIVGSPVAVLAMGEHLPDGFFLAALLILIGLSIFQARAAASH